MADPAALDPNRFHSERPHDLRTAPPWHRLSYLVNELPVALERLSRDLQVPADGRVLDFGCAEMPYRYFFPPQTEFVGADLAGNPDASVEIAADGTLPVEDGSFDAVLSTQVLEHVADPGVYLAECERVLRPGGRLLLSTHGIMVYHPDPVDYWRWTCAGLRRAVEQAGLDVVEFEGIIGLVASGLQLVHDAIFWRTPRRLQFLVSLFFQTLMRLSDRLETRAGRELNAFVFALVAEKPAD